MLLTLLPGRSGTISPRQVLIRAGIIVCCVFLLMLLAAWGVGTLLIASVNRPVGAPPPGLSAQTVAFRSASGSLLHGWFLRGRKGAGAVVLLHGVRGDRRSMLGRARLFADAGYSVLLFDFQASGESSGRHITFGYLESRDVLAAVEYVRRQAPGEKIGIVGVSLGGAAALLASPPLRVDALVLEMVFPTIDEAITDRLEMRLGHAGDLVKPLLTAQIGPRLGTSPDQLRPIDHVAHLSAPKLFVVGAEDQHTKLAESERMFRRACAPKELWVVPGASHTDLYRKAPEEYRRCVLPFLARSLRSRPGHIPGILQFPETESMPAKI